MQSKARPSHANKTAPHKVITVPDMTMEEERERERVVWTKPLLYTVSCWLFYVFVNWYVVQIYGKSVRTHTYSHV